MSSGFSLLLIIVCCVALMFGDLQVSGVVLQSWQKLSKQKLYSKAAWASVVSEKQIQSLCREIWKIHVNYERVVGFLRVDGESQWDFGLFFVEILMKKSARQNGKGNVKRGDGGHPQGRRCKSGVEEAARKWRSRGTSRSRERC